MNSSIIKIHEFSTGIQAEKTPDGGWVSRGFTGEYINKTIDPIPMAVQNAIRNRDFAVAEGASSDDPAIIGREVQSGGEVWSVVAVVTRGRDDKGRSASMYRYFLCEGGGNLGKILAWLDTKKAVRAGRIPIFDPFETKFMGQPTIYQPVNLRQIDLQQLPLLYSLLAGDTPVLVPVTQRCDTSIVNHMATEKARQTRQPVAWAYKVEALEQPRGFVVIQPASEKAEQLLQRAIASTPQYTAPIAGEYDIKSAIKGLISRDTVKPEQVQAIETALVQGVQDNDWEVIFNGQGANQARAQGIYSPQMVRLMTLRAMVIPQTLPEFLAWMQKRGKQDDHNQVSATFQQQINISRNHIPGATPKLVEKIEAGVRLIIPELLEQPELLESTVWLLSSPEGFWRWTYYYKVAAELDADFKSMASKNRNINSREIDGWEMILNDLQPYWRNQNYTGSHNEPEQYLPLAKLFSQLKSVNKESPEIAALFYHVSLKKVPKKTFGDLTSKGNSHANIYGISVTKEMGIIESICSDLVELGDQIMPVFVAVPLIILSFAVGILSGRVLTDLLGNSDETISQPRPTNNEAVGNTNRKSPITPNPAQSASTPTSLNLPDTAATAIPPVTTTPTVAENGGTKLLEDIPNPTEAKQEFGSTMNVIQKEVIDTIQEELSGEKTANGIDRATTLRNTIKELEILLKVKPNSYEEAMKGSNANEATKIDWINAIYQYQAEKLGKEDAQGYMLSGKNTATKLKNQVKEIVRKL